MVRERHCPQCGTKLHHTEVFDGAVWECRQHGVQQWMFDELGGLRP